MSLQGVELRSSKTQPVTTLTQPSQTPNLFTLLDLIFLNIESRLHIMKFLNLILMYFLFCLI